MSARHFLFPESNPPAFPPNADVRAACVWLLAVMDASDPAGRFVSSVLGYYFTHGYITDPQMAALRKVCSRIIGLHQDGFLQSQGAAPAAEQADEFGDVVKFRRRHAAADDDDGQVIE
jgi:hypothetical protein